MHESRSHVEPDIFMHSEYSARDDYKSRNHTVHDVAEVAQKL